MPREREEFRDQLESIISAYPNKECLSIRDVARYCGITEKTASKRFPFVGHGQGKHITRTILARRLIMSES